MPDQKENSDTGNNSMAVDETLDSEQLEEYKEMVDQLGTFPDKVKINTLSMVAEDHVDSQDDASKLYNIIRQPLLSKSVSGDHKLPVVYVVDSILKNVKGKYTAIIEEDAKKWFPIVYDALSEEKRVKLKKVYNLWKDAAVFNEASWKELGSCFASSPDGDGASMNPELEKAGITYGKDGSLLLMPQLRNAMQTLLDELQSDLTDELEKVSLERLAMIDADLLVKIKRTAEDGLRSGAGVVPSKTAVPAESDEGLSFLVETRTPEVIARSKAWQKLNLDPMKETHDMVHKLQHLVLEASKGEERYTQQEAVDMTGALAVAAVTATLLTNTLQAIQNEEKKSKSTAVSATGASTRGFLSVNKKMFTNEGLKEKNDAVIGILYDVGLPFVSSADGRRFATQLELSNHLDALFKKGQLEKTMARTEERGWYPSDAVWTGEAKAEDDSPTNMDVSDDKTGTVALDEDAADPNSLTMPADESRDRCVICGINFKMFFDNDDGIYKYSNCKEIEVLNDEAAAKETEDALVHVTCWRALGAPTQLTSDQTMQDAMDIS